MTNYKLYFKLLSRHISQEMVYLFFFGIILLTNLFPDYSRKQEQYQVLIVGNKTSTIYQAINSYLEEQNQVEISFLESRESYRTEEEEQNRLRRLSNEAVLSDAVDCVIFVSEKEKVAIEIISNFNDAISRNIARFVEAALKEGETSQKAQRSIVGKEMNEIKSASDCARRYLNTTIYGLSTVICVGIISVNASMNKRQLKERRSYSPNKERTEVDILKCHFLLGFMVCIILFLPVFSYDSSLLFSIKGGLLALNILLVGGNLVMIGYLLSIFVHNLSLEMIAVNVVSLGTLFMSGTLIEQWTISTLAARIGSFIPTFWYVRANNLIMMKEHLSRADHKEILEAMSIEGLFLIALVIIGLIARNERSEEEER